ncbi:UPF0125 protein RatB [Candidatus Erwinia haradaeae]|uniref:UPF0125 protein ERCILAFE3058_582 n=1 Tax=Candidatus Erwinia haradaeae TaxID=1922217 RepID=A0A451DDE1_9GAMM|nr:RnfH family protein [Candidatus Erwinia haradaeae]VFP84495.1 UPF0125 protein RatB [Candidatus Erwinia haradaeae]
MPNIAINVVYALPNKQYLYHIDITAGSTVQQAIIMSGIMHLRPEIDLTKNKVGIFGRFVNLSDTIYDGDRIEIYRPIISKPKNRHQNQ